MIMCHSTAATVSQAYWYGHGVGRARLTGRARLEADVVVGVGVYSGTHLHDYG